MKRKENRRVNRKQSRRDLKKRKFLNQKGQNWTENPENRPKKTKSFRKPTENHFEILEKEKTKEIEIPGLEEITDIAQQILTKDANERYFKSKKGQKPKNRPQKDIFGQKPSETVQTSPEKYVPKPKRVLSDLQNTPENLVLSLVKTTLNKVTESNIEEMFETIQEIYQKHSKNDVNESLLLCTKAIVFAETELSDSFAAILSALLAKIDLESLNCHNGVNFLTDFVKSFRRHYDRKDWLKARKTLAILSALYSFDIAHGQLAKDLIGFLSKETTEENMEILHAFLVGCVCTLRKNEKPFLDEFFGEFPKRMESLQIAGNSRLNLLCELVLDLRKSVKENVKLIKLKKWLKKTKNDHWKAFHLGLDDFLAENKSGQWWVEKQLINNAKAAPLESQEKFLYGDLDPAKKDKLLEQAEKLGFSRNGQKTICVMILSSTNVSTASKNIKKLFDPQHKEFLHSFASSELNSVLEKDIAEVLFSCLKFQRNYNRFYTLMLLQMLSFRKSFRFTLKLKFWDFLRELTESSRNFGERMIKNIALALGELVAESIYNLEILQRVKWNKINAGNSQFLAQFFAALFDLCSLSKLEEIVMLTNRKNKELKNCVVLFLKRNRKLIYKLYHGGQEEFISCLEVTLETLAA